MDQNTQCSACMDQNTQTNIKKLHMDQNTQTNIKNLHMDQNTPKVESPDCLESLRSERVR